MGKLGTYTRRGFLAAGGLIGGGLVLGVAFAPNRLAIKGEPTDLNTWLRITPDSRVTVIVPHCDMGQGAHTALAMMLAEELDADWTQVGIEEAPALPAYANEYIVRGLLLGDAVPAFLGHAVDAATYGLVDFMALQITGGSGSVRTTGEMGMRVAGAGARAMLVQAAAARWNVTEDSCNVSAGMVRHAASSRMLPFGALATRGRRLFAAARPEAEAVVNLGAGGHVAAARGYSGAR